MVVGAGLCNPEPEGIMGRGRGSLDVILKSGLLLFCHGSSFSSVLSFIHNLSLVIAGLVLFRCVVLFSLQSALLLFFASREIRRLMASEQKIVGKEEKGKGQNEELTTEPPSSGPITITATPPKETEKEQNEEMTTQASSSMPTATTLPAVYEWEKGQNEEITTQASSSAPTAVTAPPVPGKDESTAPPSLPPRPLSHVQAPYQLLPPHMIATERRSRHPEIFPVSNYDPTDVHPHEPEQVPFSKGWNTAKLVLSTISLIFSAVVIGLGLAIATWGGTFSTQEAIFGLTGSTAGLAIFWIAVDNVVTCLSRGRHRIPPGAHVALHLIIWLMAAASVTVLALLAQAGYHYRSRYYGGGVGRLEAAILGLMVIILVIHFVLFIRACVETHEVNLTVMRNKRTIVRYIQVPMPVDASGAPLFPGAHPGTAYPQPYPQIAMMNQAVPPGPTPYGRPHFQSHGNGISPPAQVLLGGYYAPTGPPIDPAANFQPPPGTLLHGYYGPPPAPSSVSARRSSNSGARRHSQHSGSSSRRTSQQNPSPSATPKYV